MRKAGKKLISVLLAAVFAFTAAAAAAGVTSGTAQAADVKTATWDYLIRSGCSKAAAAGIMGNIQYESSFNPRAGRSCKGLFQLGRAHYKQLQKLAKKRKRPWYDVDTQLCYATRQLSSEMRRYTKYTWSRFKKIKNVSTATTVWEKGIERARRPVMSRRIRYAKKFYNMYKYRKVKAVR